MPRPYLRPYLRPYWLVANVITHVIIVALPHALLKKPNQAAIEKTAMAQGGKKCPFCAEILKAEARVRKHCGRDLVAAAGAAPPPAPKPSPRAKPGEWDISSR